MKHFRIECEFESGHSTVAEHRATWARLEIWVNNKCVTRHQNLAEGELHSGIVRPMYPVAEWLLTNWWRLNFELPYPKRPGYWRGHHIRAAEEGFALPDLEFVTAGDLMKLVCKPHNAEHQRVEFIDDACCWLPREEVRAEFCRVIEQVVCRLKKRQLVDTFVESEFTALQRLTSDEHEFCAAAGALGVDPFQITDAAASAIELATSELPSSIQSELFAVADLSRLSLAADWVKNSLRDCADHEFDVRSLQRCVRKSNFQDRKLPPWKYGYQRAGELRQALNIAPSQAAFCLDLLAPGLDAFVESHHVEQATESFSKLDLLGDASAQDVLRISMKKQRRDSRRFAIARAIGDFLAMANNDVFVITANNSSSSSEAMTTRQRFNRAFAAELLAPAEALAQHVASDDFISEDQVADLTDKFQVSDKVIRRQLRNQLHTQVATQ